MPEYNELKPTRVNRLPSLERALQTGMDEAGRVGVSFYYRSQSGLSLALQVRLLGASTDEVLYNAPYSLRFLSHCCGEELTGYTHTACATCLMEQPAGVTREKLSILGPRRSEAIERMARALDTTTGCGPLRATIFAAEDLEEIERLHDQYLTEQWVRDFLDLED